MNLTSSVISISLLAQPGIDECFSARRGTRAEHVSDGLLVEAESSPGPADESDTRRLNEATDLVSLMRPALA
jgi:hypothetical protein